MPGDKKKYQEGYLKANGIFERMLIDIILWESKIIIHTYAVILHSDSS